MGLISFKHVSFSYSDNKIFNDLNVTFSGVGLTVILGRSGSGKSTLLSLIGKLLLPSSGEIKNTYKTEPALCFQSPLLLNYLTLKENVLLSAELSGTKDKESIEEVFNKVGILDLLDRYPSEVSGGEAMRASIARALITKSEVLILDEPTGQLDEETSNKIYELLKELSKEMLIILVTHDEKNAYKIANRLLLLQDGRLKDEKKLPKQEIENEEQNDNKKVAPISFHFSFLMTKKFLSKRKLRVFLCTVFLSFALSLFYLGLNLKNNLSNAMGNLLKEFYSYESCDIYKKTIIASSSSHLTLQRYEILSESELSVIGIEETYPSLSYFLSEEKEIFLNGETGVVKILPSFFQKEEKLKSGEVIKDTFDVVVNTSFLNTFNLGETEAIDKEIRFTEEKVVRVSSISASDVYSQTFNFKIVGVSNEKELFNYATIYYSYQKIYSLLESVYLTNISEELGSLTSVINLFNKTHYLNDDFRSQKNIIVLSDPIAFRDQISAVSENIVVTSKVLEIEESSQTIVSSLTTILGIFIFLTLISAFMLDFLAVYSLYDENIRLFALINIYPNKKKNKRVLADGTFFFFFIANIILFLILSNISVFFINSFLNKASYPSFLSVFDPIAFLLIVLLSFLITLLASSLPLKRIKDDDIKKELEGEE